MMTRRTLIQGAIATAASGAVAQPVFEPITLSLFEKSHPTHRLDDRLLDLPDGRRYRVFRAIPKAEPPADGWPVLWLTDGNAFFDRMAGELLARYPGLMIVAVGYDTDLPFASTERALDYTPPPLRPDPKRPERMVGGAAAFLARLNGPLREFAEENLPVDPHTRCLGGHSYGGLFAIYARGQQSIFSRFCAASPSFWLHPDMPAAGDAPLTIYVGDQERERGRLTDPRNPAFQVPKQTRDFVDRAAALGQDVSLSILPGLTHGQTLAGALPDMMSLAASAPE
ncbi:alpha/beta hydrolase [Paracoccus sp. SCSIO 75233]|uniref:alpha/beta hydrolase n=1 Tax=Paracoccus sp. SCSIO 75233 TaxID=3017782 RepID=UPI0022F0AE06|nr:alpha/beta hydrolase-fold protein [Paracoccus sp. SCSIO 75233]WBU54439.1 alpha/beta hydrolase [Paracoccus sp. SCSIO 75233]